MTWLNSQSPAWRGDLLALLAGALIHLGMAPYHLWPLSLLGITAFGYLLKDLSLRGCIRRAYCYGLGLYGAGAFWIYVSISQFGNSSQALALTLTGVFVAAMAFLFLPPFWVLGRWFNRGPWALWLSFPAIYVLGEWLHSWLLTGFPWLYVGYAFIDTPLAGWAPLLGVYGVSLVAIFVGLILASLLMAIPRVKQRWRTLAVCIAALGVAVGGGSRLQQRHWTELSSTPVTLGMVQANTPQEEKWDRAYYAQTLGTYRDLSRPLWGKVDWLIWPEAAIPLLFHEADALLDNLDRQGKDTNTTFISGIIYDEIEEDKYFNSIFAKGAAGSGLYFKQRLVPFGEYVPFDAQLRGVIEFFDLPTSIVHKGAPSKALLKAKDVWIAPAICYELAYPELIAEHARDAGVILAISNNAWFGDSIGPDQHFEMTRMRALETGRYLVHATNNGVTAIVNPKGGVEGELPRFQRLTLTGQLFPADGLTPFMLWGVWPILIVSALMLATARFRTGIDEKLSTE